MGRKKKNIVAGKERLYQSFDWSVDPQTSKEILSLLTLAVGVLFFLSVFGGAGSFGKETLKVLNNLFGLAGFLAPFVLLATGISLWKAREVKLKGPAILGLLSLFVFVPGLFGIFNSGGLIGDTIGKFFVGNFGALAGFLIILSMSIVAGLLATNLSLTQIKHWLLGQSNEPSEELPAQIPETRVSVFQNVRNKFASRPNASVISQAPVAPMPQIPKHVHDQNWVLPPFDLLPLITSKAQSGNIDKNVITIQKSLKDFGIDVAMSDVNIGPTVTQYTLKPAEGVKLTAITARSNDLSLALAAHPIRIEAPIPGKAAVGVEIPNKVSAIVTLREILDSDDFRAIKSNLTIALGRDVAGAPFVADIQKMPHLLVAGSTGSGKSVAINALILSLLFQNSPADLRIILIDPKRVEFTMYNGIPHLLTNVVTEVDKMINSLRWVVAEMERRFKLFSETHKRNIIEYNTNPTDGHLPYLVVVIDELADLMAQAANEAEAAIVRLAQLARATGIHLIVATQRPSVDVITGLIKANITTRIAFAVASQIDSRTIIDQAGAEKLLGNGDMLYLGGDLSRPKRVQGVLVGEKEIKAVTDFLKREGETTYDNSIQDYHPTGSRGGKAGSQGDAIDDELFDEAKQTVIQYGKASASLLQRRLRVGYARAARLLDLLEQEGIVGSSSGAKPRDIISHDSSVEYQPSSTAPVYQPPDYNSPRPDDDEFKDQV